MTPSDVPAFSWRSCLKTAPGLKPLQSVKMFLTGPSKSGKSSFAASFPRAFIVDTEDKAELVGKWGEGTQAFSPKALGNRTSLQVYESCIHELTAAKNKDFDFIVIDTLDDLVDRVLVPGLTEELRAEKPNALSTYEDIRDYKASTKGSGGYEMIRNRLLNPLYAASRAGYGIVVIGHEKKIVVKIPNKNGGFDENTVTVPSVYPNIVERLQRWCWAQGRAVSLATKVTTEEAYELPNGKKGTRSVQKVLKEYRIYLEQTGPDSELAGNNCSLPPEIRVPGIGGGFAALEEAWAAAAAKENKSHV